MFDTPQLRLPAATARLITAEAKDTGAYRQQLTKQFKIQSSKFKTKEQELLN